MAKLHLEVTLEELDRICSALHVQAQIHRDRAQRYYGQTWGLIAEQMSVADNLKAEECDNLAVALREQGQRG